MTTLFGYDHNKLLGRDIKDTEATTHVQYSPETLEAVLSKWKITAGVYGFTSSATSLPWTTRDERHKRVIHNVGFEESGPRNTGPRGGKRQEGKQG
jgi:hypothetical protein